MAKSKPYVHESLKPDAIREKNKMSCTIDKKEDFLLKEAQEYANWVTEKLTSKDDESNCKLSTTEKAQYKKTGVGWMDKVIPTGTSVTGHMFLQDQVKHPPHYQLCDVEAKDIIKLVLNSDLCKDMDRWQAACFKDVLKYRLRAGKKGDTVEDINKALEYERLYDTDKPR